MVVRLLTQEYGRIITKRTRVVKDGNQSREWDTEITSKLLEDPVKTVDYEYREVGTRVQVVLNPNDKHGKTAAQTVFHLRWGPNDRTNEAWVKFVHEDWRIGKFPGDYYE